MAWDDPLRLALARSAKTGRRTACSAYLRSYQAALRKEATELRRAIHELPVAFRPLTLAEVRAVRIALLQEAYRKRKQR